ncbi:MAG: hypothetical protein J2P53_16070, partial [Bradyrhizobiaceae bacterium]|nr:hypothetical protein [Bradyrhizobiaceae bacterium]
TTSQAPAATVPPAAAAPEAAAPQRGAQGWSAAAAAQGWSARSIANCWRNRAIDGGDCYGTFGRRRPPPQPHYRYPAYSERLALPPDRCRRRPWECRPGNYWLEDGL